MHGGWKRRQAVERKTRRCRQVKGLGAVVGDEEGKGRVPEHGKGGLASGFEETGCSVNEDADSDAHDVLRRIADRRRV